MAIAPGALQPVTMHARLSARYHAQLAIVARESRGERGSLRARVVRFFRANGALRVGDEITFDVPVHPPSGVAVSPDFNSYDTAAALNEFMAARYVEAFLEREKGRCRLAADQFALLAAPTDAPRLRVPTEKEVRSEWKRFGYSMPPSGVAPGGIEVQAVVAMRDQDGNQNSSPEFFSEWMDEMKAGDSLTFDHAEGGHLVIKGPARGPFAIDCRAGDGRLIAATTRLEREDTEEIVFRYIRGDAPEVIEKVVHEPKPRTPGFVQALKDRLRAALNRSELLCGDFVLEEGPEGRILEIAFSGVHEPTHGNRIVDFIKSSIEKHAPVSAVLINLLDYEYESGNDVAGLYVAFHDSETGRLRPACIVANGTTYESLQSLFAEANLVDAFQIRFAWSVDEALRSVKVRERNPR